MADDSKDPDSNHNSPPNGHAKELFRRKKGVRILGIDRERGLKYFFGGNASLAIVFLLLICVFLFREAFEFFPAHHEKLQDYRKSGQEFVDFIRKEVKEHEKVANRVTLAYNAEINESQKHEQDLRSSYYEILEKAEIAANRERRFLMRGIAQMEVIDEKIEALKSEGEPGQLAELEAEVAEKEKEIVALRDKLRRKMRSVLDDPELALNELDGPFSPSESDYKNIAEAVASVQPDADDDPSYVQELSNTIYEKQQKAMEEYADFGNAKDDFVDAIEPLQSMLTDFTELARETRESVQTATTLIEGKAALLEAAENAETEELKKENRDKANAITIEEVDFAARNKPLYGSIDKHQKLIEELIPKLEAAMKALPEEGDTDKASELLEIARDEFPDLVERLKETTPEMREWKHDEPFPWSKSIAMFVLGTDWVTNSDWHEFYGIQPLFVGSLMISIIALVVAVPFSIGAAIYVNQIAGFRQQNAIKPVIEFIQAIPSIVLGFFGIAVLGTFLRDISYLEWLSWVPGFPMQERLNILTAGLLLAFMAIPTIFTLTEDALNNVPRHYTEASLAVGASKLQTVLRVIVPSSLSGIIAAVLLGFGRIIGETMVVLLVAGGTISIPDFSEGLGVVTQPAHTMTGIIAQETGEAAQGSLHWRALFMIGLVLFSISLVINFSAQRVLKRYQAKGA